MDHKSLNIESNISSSSSSSSSNDDHYHSEIKSSELTTVKTERWEFPPSNVYKSDESSTGKRKCSCISLCQCLLEKSQLPSPPPSSSSSSPSSSTLSSSTKKNETSPSSLQKKPGWRKFLSRNNNNNNKPVDNFLNTVTKNNGQESSNVSNCLDLKFPSDISISYSDTQLKPYIMSRAKSLPKHHTTMSVQIDPKVISQAEQIDEFMHEMSIKEPSLSYSKSSSRTMTTNRKDRSSSSSFNKTTQQSMVNCPFDPLTGTMKNNDTLTLKHVKIWPRNKSVSYSSSSSWSLSSSSMKTTAVKRRSKNQEKK